MVTAHPFTFVTFIVNQSLVGVIVVACVTFPALSKYIERTIFQEASPTHQPV